MLAISMCLYELGETSTFPGLTGVSLCRRAPLWTACRYSWQACGSWSLHGSYWGSDLTKAWICGWNGKGQGKSQEKTVLDPWQGGWTCSWREPRPPRVPGASDPGTEQQLEVVLAVGILEISWAVAEGGMVAESSKDKPHLGGSCS